MRKTPRKSYCAIAQGVSDDRQHNRRVGAVLADTRFIPGPNVEAFEREAAAYLGVEHALGCASGTDALHRLSGFP